MKLKLKGIKISFLIVGMLAFVSLSAFGQRDLTHRKKVKRSDVFGGAQDVRSLKNYGIQVSLGFNYTFTGKSYSEHLDLNGRPVDFTLNPSGKIGGYFDIGTAHFPLGTPRLTILKSRFISYYDWGLGFKMMGGKESLDLKIDTKTSQGEGSFYNGYVSLRGTAHKNIYFGDKYYLDNGLGVNFDYRVLTGNQVYSTEVKSPLTSSQIFQKPFIAQCHFDLGFGIKKKRGSYIIPGIQLPLFGYGGARINWFSSKYYPVQFKIKFIVLGEKKKSKTSCNQGSEEDRKRNNEYMQGQ